MHHQGAEEDYVERYGAMRHFVWSSASATRLVGCRLLVGSAKCVATSALIVRALTGMEAGGSLMLFWLYCRLKRRLFSD